MTGGPIFWVWFFSTWAVAIAFLHRLGWRPMLLLYVWHGFIETPLNYVAYLWAKRRSERIARFLRTAEELRMRDKRVDYALALGPARQGGAGEGGVAG
jgi:hypothetical protein